MPRMRYKVSIFIAILTLMLFSMSIFSFQVFASTGESEPLIVNAAWLDGETVRIDVTDSITGTSSSLALPLKNYMKDGDNSEFISIQAVDLNGKQSDVIEIRNPFYNPNLPQTDKETGGNDKETVTTSAVDNPNANSDLRPLSPDGTGTVVDNANETDGKEFFTINSVDGSEFFLIVDRQKEKENVYFLNAVTEQDLIALAEKNGTEIKEPNTDGTSAIQTPEIEPTPQTPAEEVDDKLQPTTELAEDEPPSALNRIGGNFMIMIVIAVVVGGLAYYIKVVRPKKNGYDDDYEDEDELGIEEALDDEIDDNGGENE